jgi:hypothetical protein
MCSNHFLFSYIESKKICRLYIIFLELRENLPPLISLNLKENLLPIHTSPSLPIKIDVNLPSLTTLKSLLISLYLFIYCSFQHKYSWSTILNFSFYCSKKLKWCMYLSGIKRNKACVHGHFHIFINAFC